MLANGCTQDPHSRNKRWKDHDVGPYQGELHATCGVHRSGSQIQFRMTAKDFLPCQPFPDCGDAIPTDAPRNRCNMIAETGFDELVSQIGLLLLFALLAVFIV